MHRSLKSYVDQAARQERELQRLVYLNGASARGSVAQRVYAHLVRDNAADVSHRESPTRKPDTAASRIYPHLSHEGGK
jgi:hypothetical protein